MPAATSTNADAASGGAASRSARHAARHRAPAYPQTDLQAVLTEEDARHLLTRTGFQPDAVSLESWVGSTRGEALERLLAPAAAEALVTPPAWVDEAPPTRAERKAWSPDQRRDAQRRNGERYDELRRWWLRQMVATGTPLTERMTLFWHGHFTSAQEKVAEPQAMYRQNLLLRRDALGSFADLLHAVAKDPAMLLYLDGASSRKGHPNENFAREVMELFTLGIGHYDERDVREAARAYTGWSVDPDTGAYQWLAAAHDDGEKTVLGQQGAFDGDQVLDILLAQPETADWICARLWREFVATEPDPTALAPIADSFRTAHYDLRVALRGVLSSPAFWDPLMRGLHVKSPAEYVVGTVRQFGVLSGSAGDADAVPLERAMRQLGQVLFAPPNVKGWPGGDTWIDSATLLARKQFVEQLWRATDHAARATHAPAASTAIGLAMGAAPVRHDAGLHFDLDGWLGQWRLQPQDAPSLTQALAMQRAVLSIAAVDPIPAGADSSAYLQALLMDPAYQLT
jgi:uncharacterized protein (DUF1800 family)